MPPARSKPDQSICVFGAGVMLEHLNALDKELQGVRGEEEDIEFVHRARVASRRLRATIPLFEKCLPTQKVKKWQGQIRKVTRALGEARDTDVQIERVKLFSESLRDAVYKAGMARLELRLRQQRDRLQEPVNRTIDRVNQGGLIPEMRAQIEPVANLEGSVYLFTPALYRHSFEAIHNRLEEFLAYQDIVDQPEKITELHQMRIAAKWLRYTMETFARLYSSELKTPLQVVRKFQDTLGDIHDCDVWIDFLPAFLAAEHERVSEFFGSDRNFRRLVPGINHFLEERKQARSDLYQGFVGAWHEKLDAGTWKDLQETIQTPFFQNDALYPPAATVQLDDRKRVD